MVVFGEPHRAGPAWMLARAGRVLVGALFLISGSLKIAKYAGIASLLAAKGVPIPAVVAALTIVLEMTAGLALITGWRVRHAAVSLAVFVVLATPMFHAFWSADAVAYQNQLNHFLKNVAILGALLLVATSGPRRAQEDLA